MAIVVKPGTAQKMVALSEDPLESIVQESVRLGDAPTPHGGEYEQVRTPSSRARFAARNEQEDQPIQSGPPLPSGGGSSTGAGAVNPPTRTIQIVEGADYESTEFAFADFGFDIPSGAIVRGLEVRVTRSALGHPAVEDTGEILLCGSFDEFRIHYLWEHPLTGPTRGSINTWRPTETLETYDDESDQGGWRFAANADSSLVLAIGTDTGAMTSVGLKSTDRGKTWSSFTPPTLAVNLAFTGSEFVTFSLADSKHYASVDGDSWTAWTQITDGGKGPPVPAIGSSQESVSTFVQEIGGKLYAVGDDSGSSEAAVYISADDGASWNLSEMGSGDNDNFDIASSGSSILAGGPLHVFRTTDFSVSPTWTRVDPGEVAGYLYDYWADKVGDATEPGEGWEAYLDDHETVTNGIEGPVAYGNGRYVAGAEWRAGVYYSDDDGLTWTYVDLWNQLAVSEGSGELPNSFVDKIQFRAGLFHICLKTSEVFVSADGVNWAKKLGEHATAEDERQNFEVVL